MASTGNSNRLIALGCVLLTAQAQAAGWAFSPKISVSERFTDNLTLAEGANGSSFITEVSPGFTLAHKGARATVNVDYGLQGLWYSDASDSTKIYNNLSSQAHAELMEDRFFLDAVAKIGQQNKSLFGSVGGNNYNLTGNRTEVRSLSVTPSWHSRFGATAEFDARWQLTQTESDSSAVLGSTSGSHLSFGLRNGTAFHKTPWSLAYRTQRNEGANATRLSSVSANIGYLPTRKTRVNVSLGRDENNRGGVGNYDRATGAYWNIGGHWTPTSRTTLGATIGHRYNGQSYGLNFSHRTRKTNWALSYTEAVLDVYSQLNAQPAYDLYICNGLEYPVAQGDPPPDPACVGPTVALPTDASPNNDVSLNKTWSGSLAWRVGKSTLTGSLNQRRRETLASGVVDDYYSLSGIWNWRLNTRTTSSLSLVKSQANGGVNGTDTWSMAWSLSRRLSPDTTGTVEVRHYEGTSNTAGNYTENSATVRLNMSF